MYIGVRHQTINKKAQFFTLLVRYEYMIIIIYLKIFEIVFFIHEDQDLHRILFKTISIMRVVSTYPCSFLSRFLEKPWYLFINSCLMGFKYNGFINVTFYKTHCTIYTNVVNVQNLPVPIRVIGTYYIITFKFLITIIHKKKKNKN